MKKLMGCELQDFYACQDYAYVETLTMQSGVSIRLLLDRPLKDKKGNLVADMNCIYIKNSYDGAYYDPTKELYA